MVPYRTVLIDNLLALLEAKPFQCQKLLPVESSQSVASNETALKSSLMLFVKLIVVFTFMSVVINPSE